MTLDEYLAQFIEGYLLEDLTSMAEIRLAPGKRYGAVGYPMVMTVLSGIEVLGVLTSRTTFKQENGAARFSEFWRDYVYADRPAFARLAPLMYEFVRQGLAHRFMTMPMIRVTKHRDGAHLCRTDDDVVCVDALTLAEDFEAAYRQRLRPKIAGEFKANMEARFNEMRQANWQEREAKKHKLLDKVPSRSHNPVGEINRAMQVNSPSVQPLHSTNVSTTGFDEPKD